MNYQEFLERRRHLGGEYGFSPSSLPSFLFDFQAYLVDWALRKGRAEVMADCGTGKTPMQLVWADKVREKTDGNVLILTPLAVSHQTKAEGEKFGIEVHRSHHGEVKRGINITNYERLCHFNPSDFEGVVCDESSILKNFDGVHKQEITEFMRKVKYRLLMTATAAPNDYHELGTSSEALGEMGYMDMLNKFFKNDLNNSATGRAYGMALKWRFKGHAEQPFWRWVSSWARAMRKPSDLGFDDARFILPSLVEEEHIVGARKIAPGMLFEMPVRGLKEQREEQRRSIPERCERVADLVQHNDPSLVWCHFNEEGDLLEKLIPGSVQVSGKDSDEAKEEKFLGFVRGDFDKLITKPKIGAWGLNFQHCAHETFFPSHSFEQYYQCVRRCYRFGQTRSVKVDIVTTEGGSGIMKNLQRKAEQADRMFDSLIAHMNDALNIKTGVTYAKKLEVPTWL